MYKKIILFISSYVPLYFLLLSKDLLERFIAKRSSFSTLITDLKNAFWFNKPNDYCNVVLISLICFSIISLFIFLKRTSGDDIYTIESFSNESSTYSFSYISLYLISCFNLSLNNYSDIFILIFINIIIGIIYVTNDLIYINPILQLIGYKIYMANISYTDNSIKIENHNTIILIKPKIQIKKNENYWATKISTGVLYISKQ